jgi:hypothetical protein
MPTEILGMIYVYLDVVGWIQFSRVDKCLNNLITKGFETAELASGRPISGTPKRNLIMLAKVRYDKRRVENRLIMCIANLYHNTILGGLNHHTLKLKRSPYGVDLDCEFVLDSIISYVPDRVHGVLHLTHYNGNKYRYTVKFHARSSTIISGQRDRVRTLFIDNGYIDLPNISLQIISSFDDTRNDAIISRQDFVNAVDDNRLENDFNLSIEREVMDHLEHLKDWIFVAHLGHMICCIVVIVLYVPTVVGMVGSEIALIIDCILEAKYKRGCALTFKNQRLSLEFRCACSVPSTLKYINKWALDVSREIRFPVDGDPDECNWDIFSRRFGIAYTHKDVIKMLMRIRELTSMSKHGR